MAFFAENLAKARAESAAEDAATGKRLRGLRRRKGLLACWVAKKIGVGDTYFCHLEKGRRHWTTDLVAAYLRTIGEEQRTKQYPALYGRKTSTK